MAVKLALASVLLLALGAVWFFGRSPSFGVHDDFKDFVEKHHKVYASDDEYAYRQSVYYDNAAKVAAHNAKQLPWELTLNEFADLTAEEFKAQHTTKYQRSQPQLVLDLSTDSLPTAVDWRAQGAVTAVKNQGVCGSCWSFSTTGSIEGAHFLATGNLVSLSEQQLINCSFGLKYDNFACLGGQMNRAFQYVIDAGGLEPEALYPYNPYLDLLCHAKSEKFAASISSFSTVQQGSQLQLKAAVAQQPVSVAVEANQDSWQLYKGGIITSDCGQSLDHGVLVVGYGTDNGTDYWIVKNSWGASWGENGFLRILRDDTDTTGGLCGIAMDASYPVV